MNIIVATWYDEMNQPYMSEFYESQIKEENLFSFYETQKRVYGRTVIAAYPDTRVFSDGSRVVLTLNQVYSKIDDEEAIEIETVQDYIRLPLVGESQ